MVVLDELNIYVPLQSTYLSVPGFGGEPSPDSITYSAPQACVRNIIFVMGNAFDRLLQELRKAQYFECFGLWPFRIPSKCLRLG